MTGAAKNTAKTTAKRAVAIADDVHNSTWFEWAARAGFAVNGLLHVLIGVLAISVAIGAGADDADPGGALRAVAQTPGGLVLVWVLAAGLAALTLWLIAEAVLDHFLKREVKTGVVLLAKAGAYGALAASAMTIGIGGEVDTDSDVRAFSAFLVQSPIGIGLLIAGGVAVLGIGAYFVVKGARRTFLDDIAEGTGSSKDAIVVLGTIGYIAKGISLGALGVLLVVTAVTVDPATAGGLDEALRSVTDLPFGVVLLVLVALGLIAYGVYCGVRARRAPM